MKISLRNTLLLCAGMLAASQAHAQLSAIRVTCAEADGQVEISINGVFKGECPLDLQVKPGTVVVRAVKPVDATHERVFEAPLRIGEGVVKRLEVELPPPKLTAAAALAEAGRQRVAAERGRIEQAEAERVQKLNDTLREENRKFDSERSARTVMIKRRTSFDELEKFKGSAAYRSLSNASRDDILHILSLPAEQYREFPASTAISANDLIEHDAFFEVPQGDGKQASNTYTWRNFDTSNTCSRSGRSAQVDATLVQRKLFGGITLWRKTSFLLGGVIQHRESQFLTEAKDKPHASYTLAKIHSLFGQPFPLKSGSRFGIAYQLQTAYGNTPGPSDEWSTSCAFLPAVDARGGRLACISVSERYPSDHVLSRYSWDQASGCMMPSASEDIAW